ncbi:GNAT family N-acetyltransferase [Saccharothrix sp. ST-888]|uniref:GNAT family N-acetyltransferase n=1 Tax=Saccharothrix sp. ST-888 TaxID=1427391 RepID=UPI0005ECDB1B|nr:GNAT family N-acetyltransferase [Saccharothrix sp. ST-888]KJK59669.1 acetyltransferase [Saccharothrix sp. ST-888]
MSTDPTTVLTTGRLAVRRWRAGDRERAFDLYSRTEVTRWLGRSRTLEQLVEADALIERFRTRSADPRYGVWAVERRDTGVVAGSVLLVPIPDGGGEVEVGWHFHPDSWGHGFATEAARAAAAKGFADGLAEIYAVTHPDNHASQAVCRRLGMTALGRTDRWYGTELAAFRLAAPR